MNYDIKKVNFYIRALMEQFSLFLYPFYITIHFFNLENNICLYWFYKWLNNKKKKY